MRMDRGRGSLYCVPHVTGVCPRSVLPFDDVDQPSFYCNWHKVKATDSTILTGPVAASVSSLDKASVNLTAIHESPPTCATTSCAVAQPRLVPTVDCPVPDVTKLLSGDGTIYLTLTYAAPVSSSLYAIPIPFVGNGPNAVSFTSAPPSPPANPPNPPPPSPSPPPPSPVTPPPPAHAVAWYKVTTGSTENDGNDVRMARGMAPEAGGHSGDLALPHSL